MTTSQMESLFATGHEVGAIAQQVFGGPDGVEVPFSRNLGSMIAETRRLLESGGPIYEATFRTENVLVRVDVLLPTAGGWRAIEVKASTSVKDYHVLDCAIQDWVLRNAGLELKSISLAHINNRFVYGGDGDYEGLFELVDLTEDVRTVEPTVVDMIAKARDAVLGYFPEVIVGAQCSKPYDCQFQAHCWPVDTDYPIRGLGGSKAKLGMYVAQGASDIRDVDAADITADTQLRIHRVTCDGVPEILDGARRAFGPLPYPRYFLDFETIAPAVPFWEGTRPYAAVPVQWSCHIDDGSGSGRVEDMRHEEFLDLSGTPPMRDLAEKMIACLGTEGPVLMYTNYEERVIEGLVDMFPDLELQLRGIIDRLFDLHPVVRDNYYHPEMLGSWSIKAVMPTISPDMDYAKLEGIREGTAASDGYIEAIDAGTSAERKEELRKQLLRYCRFDTEAMVEIVRFFQFD